MLDPLNNAELIVPSDTVNHVPPYKAIYFGGAGDAEIVSAGSDSAVGSMSVVPVGKLIRISFKRVNFTFTTATNMIGFW